MLLGDTLADVTPACPRRCRCNLAPALKPLAKLIDAAAAGGPGRCKRKLGAAAETARRLRRRANGLVTRGCAASPLGVQAKLLRDRVQALLGSGFCGTR